MKTLFYLLSICGCWAQFNFADVAFMGEATNVPVVTASSAPSFVATNLDGYPCYAFYFASNAYYTTASGLATWANLSSGGSALDLTNKSSGTASQPGYRTTAYNNHPALLFDGADDYLRSTVHSLTQPFEIWLVTTVTNHANAIKHYWDDDANSSRYFAYQSADHSTFSYSAGTAVNQPVYYLSNKLFVITVVCNGASSQFYTNNVKVGADANAGTGAGTGLTLGSRFSFDQRWYNGDCLQFIIFNTNLSRTATGSASNLFNWITNLYAMSPL